MLRGVNLIKADRRQARQCGIRLRRWALGCAIYVAVLVIVGTMMAWRTGGEGVEALSHRVKRVDAKIERTRAAIDEVKPRVRQAAAALAVGRTLRNQPDWAMMLGLFSQLLGPKAVLTGCQLGSVVRPPVVAVKENAKSPSGAKAANPASKASKSAAPPPVPDVTKRDYRVNLIGLCQSQGDVLGYVRRLEQTGLFAAVRLLDTNQHAGSETPAVAFHIECLLSGD